MQIKCDYCGNYIPDSEPVCPNCGAPNNGVKRTSDEVPHTIEGLKEYVRKNNIPVDELRFFIGIDYREAKAFGIYKDENTGNFIVYKNKGDGERAVRYEGKDEAYAVNEIYQKLKEKENDYKYYNKVRGNNPTNSNTSQGTPDNGANSNRNNKKSRLISLIIIAIVIFFALRFGVGRSAACFMGGCAGSGYESSYDGYDSDGGSFFDWGDSDSDSGSDWDMDWDSDWGGDWDSDW